MIKRMLPPGKVRYFFSNLTGILLARDIYEIEFNHIPIEIVTLFSYTTFLSHFTSGS